MRTTLGLGGLVFLQLLHPTLLFAFGSSSVVAARIVWEAFPHIITVEQVGRTEIEPENNYSENTLLRAIVTYPLGHPLHGQPVERFNGLLEFHESFRTRNYHARLQRRGGTVLPAWAEARSGVATLMLKSLSGHDTEATRPEPPAATIHVRTANVFDGVIGGSIVVPQWVDADQDPFHEIDWLTLRSNSILACLKATAAGETAAVLSSLHFIRQTPADCGETDREDAGYTIRVGPWCGRLNEHRLNLTGQLTNTIAHEARHAWVDRALLRNTISEFIHDDDGNPGTLPNDDDQDLWPEYLDGFASAAAVTEAGSDSRSDNHRDFNELTLPRIKRSENYVQERDARTFASTVMGRPCR